jgi:hypothetical protein
MFKNYHFILTRIFKHPKNRIIEESPSESSNSKHSLQRKKFNSKRSSIKTKKTVNFYDAQPESDKIVPKTFRSKLSGKRLNLSEQAQQEVFAQRASKVSFTNMKGICSAITQL